MLSIITTLLLTLASVSFASPVIHFRQTGLSPSCDGFGDGAFDTASNFTLAAFNKPFVEGETGIPLVITLFQTFDGSDFFALSTEATATQPTDFPNLSLISGGLIGNGPSGTATGENVPEGFEPESVTPAATDEPPAQVWCGVPASASSSGIDLGHPFLAVNNDIDDFFLCTVPSSGLVNVVFEPTEPNAFDYDIDTCFSIFVAVIE